jgi:predicted amidohydrolase
MFNVLGGAAVLAAGAEPLDGPTLTWARDLAASHGVWLVAGSIIERAAGQDCRHNTSCLIDPAGQVRAVYRKLHLFDADVPGAMLRESDTVRPGDEVVSAEVDGVRVGLAICYDLRVGQSAPGLRWFGRSMIVDPWGLVLARAPDRECHVVADLDFAAQDAVRAQLPCLANRRPDVYGS